MAKGVEAVVRQARIDLLIGLREAIQPDGLINSKEGTRTIESITKAINSIIDSEVALT